MFRKSIITLALLIPLFVFGQEEAPKVVVGPVTKQQKAAEKKRDKQKEKDEKAQKKGAKQLFKMQTKETRKRMKHDMKEAERYNHQDKKKGFFLTRWMKKKHH